LWGGHCSYGREDCIVMIIRLFYRHKMPVTLQSWSSWSWLWYSHSILQSASSDERSPAKLIHIFMTAKVTLRYHLHDTYRFNLQSVQNRYSFLHADALQHAHLYPHTKNTTIQEQEAPLPANPREARLCIYSTTPRPPPKWPTENRFHGP
jgi:hypothetical protein